MKPLLGAIHAVGSPRKPDVIWGLRTEPCRQFMVEQNLDRIFVASGSWAFGLYPVHGLTYQSYFSGHIAFFFFLCLFFFFLVFFFFFNFFLFCHTLRHLEVPRLEIESGQIPDLHHSCSQRRILNLLH